MGTKDELRYRLRLAIELDHMLGQMNGVEAAYREAARRAQVDAGTPEYMQHLAHQQHICSEQAFREAARNAGYEPFAAHTNPKGGRFSLVRLPGLVLGRARIAKPGPKMRRAKYRRQLGVLNTFLDGYNLDLFQDVPKPDDSTLYALLVSAPNTDMDRVEEPAYVGIHVPTADLKGWLFREPLDKFVMSYFDQDDSGAETTDGAVPDLAKPTLKKRVVRKGEDE